MPEQKPPQESNEQNDFYSNHTEAFPENKGSTLSHFFLFIWYIILGVAGIVLLGVVALFVACMV